VCRLRRTVCESVGERSRDRAGSLRTVGIPGWSHRWLHTCSKLARAVGAADGSTTEKRRRERAGCGAQSARVSGSDGAPAQAACVPWVSGHNDGCTHVGTGGRRGRSFDHREAAARIEPVDVLTCMRMTVRLCAKEYRFETSGDMWHGESCGYRRMSS